MEEKKTFTYTYSASEQDEIARIREKYEPKEETAMDRLRKLDAGVTRKGTAAALVVGIVSCLVFGIGLCCVMVWSNMAAGIPLGIVGMAGMALACPLYNRITAMERKRIAPEILKLTEELMK